MSTQDSCQCGPAMLASHSARTRSFIKRGNMNRLVFKGRCDLPARCAIRFVCLAMCLMYRTFGALAQHYTTCCKQTMGFPYIFFILSSSLRHFQHTRTSLSGCSEAQQTDFPCQVRLNMCINTHVSRALSFWGWACMAITVSHFKWSARPPAVLASPVDSRGPLRNQGARYLPGATFKGPDLHNIQGSVSGRPRRLLSHSARGCDSDELRANSRMRRAPDGRV